MVDLILGAYDSALNWLQQTISYGHSCHHLGLLHKITEIDLTKDWPHLTRISRITACNFTVRMLYSNMYWLLYILELRFVLFLCTTAVCNKRICYVTLSLFANSNYLYAAVSACVSVYSVQCLMIVRCFVLPALTRFTRGSRQTTQVRRTILVLLALLMCPNMCYCNFAFSLYSWHFIFLSYIVLSIVSLSSMYYVYCTWFYRHASGLRRLPLMFN